MADPGHFENPRTCFLVGVSGYMDLVADEVEPLKQRVRRLFQFLRHGASRQLVDQLVADLVPDPVSDEHSRRLRSGYRAALSRWKGLGAETPIVVLCNLAPGVDTLVAELVLDEFLRDNFQLRYPLPFPPHIYCGASTFVRFKDGHAVEGNQNRQRAVLEDFGPHGSDLTRRRLRSHWHPGIILRAARCPAGGLTRNVLRRASA